MPFAKQLGRADNIKSPRLLQEAGWDFHSPWHDFFRTCHPPTSRKTETERDCSRALPGKSLSASADPGCHKPGRPRNSRICTKTCERLRDGSWALPVPQARGGTQRVVPSGPATTQLLAPQAASSNANSKTLPWIEPPQAPCKPPGPQGTPQHRHFRGRCLPWPRKGSAVHSALGQHENGHRVLAWPQTRPLSPPAANHTFLSPLL